VESLVRLVVSGFELLEAEGRMLREQLVRIAIAMAIGVIIVLLAMVGLAFLLFSLFRWLATSPLTPTGASAVFGIISLVLAGAGAFTIRQLLSSPHRDKLLTADNSPPNTEMAHEPH
jgi:hypothetical protein